MSNTFEILNPVREVKLSARTVVVRELPWKEQKIAIDKITKQLNAVTQTGETQSTDLRKIPLQRIADTVRESSELIEWLLLKATDLKADEIDALGTTELFAILEHVFELNVGSYIAGTKKVFGRIGNLRDNKAAVMTPTIASASQ